MEITDDLQKQFIVRDPRDVRLDEITKAYNDLQFAAGESMNQSKRRIDELLRENKRLNSELAIKAQVEAIQIIDSLLSRAGFDHWWGDLTQDLKEEVLEGITQVLREKI